MDSGRTRTERDSMGELAVPAEALYGASTQRAVLNFPISGRGIPGRMVHALGLIKWAAAGANQSLGLLSPERAAAIERAALEVAEGAHDDQFVVDVYQTGSGTSSNMNANEVIANRATELLGGTRGSRDRLHPNDHVNLGQSSNDVIPSAIHLAARLALRDTLEPGLDALAAALQGKSEELWDTLKSGRTHLQDATPIRLGQVFRGYAGLIRRGRRRLGLAHAELDELALGGTAVGTGLNTHPAFASHVCAKLSERCGLRLRETNNHFQAQSSLDGILAVSSALRNVALAAQKVAHDIRWLASGPRSGLGEIRLPAVQPGSSIMPGKINPVIAESLIQVASRIVGEDQTIVQAAQWGCFELNTMLPLAGQSLIESIELLGAASGNFAERCVTGIQATSRGPRSVERSLALATGLVPRLGYDRATEIAKRAADSGRSVREVAAEQTDLSSEELDAALDPFAMT